jgi:hypothetical protein
MLDPSGGVVDNYVQLTNSAKRFRFNFLLNAAFAMEIMNLIFHVHLASFVIMLTV